MLPALLLTTDSIIRSGIKAIMLPSKRTVLDPSSFGQNDIANAKGIYEFALVQQDLRAGLTPFTGGETARELKRNGLRAILLSKPGADDDSLFELLRTEAVTGAINLNIAVHEIADVFKRYDSGYRFPNCVSRFHLKSKGESAVSRSEAAIWDQMSNALGRAKIEPLECALLLRRLISPNAKTVELESFSGGKSGAMIFRARVSFGDGPVNEDLAIKYGFRETINSEALHYDRYVGPLPDGAGAQLRWRAETENLGALAYSWVGDSVEDGVPIGPFSSERSLIAWDRRRAVIDRLFGKSLHSWFRIYRDSKEIDRSWRQELQSYYLSDGNFGISKASLMRDFGTPPRAALPDSVLRSDQGWMFIALSKETLKDPVSWVTALTGRKKLSRLAPVHGDLHVKNIYALPDDSPRLIDFGTTTLSHVYRDFAALETSIRLTCIDDTDRWALKAAEDQVCEATDLGSEIDFRGTGGSADLREAIRTTVHIRRAALEASGYCLTRSEGMQEYLFALVMHMLRYATGRADEVAADKDHRKASRVWHALYAAAKAATRAQELAGK